MHNNNFSVPCVRERIMCVLVGYRARWLFAEKATSVCRGFFFFFYVAIVTDRPWDRMSAHTRAWSGKKKLKIKNNKSNILWCTRLISYPEVQRLTNNLYWSCLCPVLACGRETWSATRGDAERDCKFPKTSNLRSRVAENGEQYRLFKKPNEQNGQDKSYGENVGEKSTVGEPEAAPGEDGWRRVERADRIKYVVPVGRCCCRRERKQGEVAGNSERAGCKSGTKNSRY